MEKGITKVSQFVKFLADLLGSVSDRLRDAIATLGGFSTGKAVKESEDPISQASKSEEEATFLRYVEMYVKGRLDDKNYLNEDALDAIEGAVSKNKFLSTVICSKFGDKKVGFWKGLLISIVGCVVISLGVGFMCSALGVATATAPVTSILLLIWQCRGIMAVIIKRKGEVKASGDDKAKMWNRATIISILLECGILLLFNIPCIQELISSVAGFVGDTLQQFLDGCKDQSTEGIMTLMVKFS